MMEAEGDPSSLHLARLRCFLEQPGVWGRDRRLPRLL